MSFKEYDKKFRNFRPDLKYWEEVLLKSKTWDDLSDNGANPKYKADEKELLKATDRVARAMYIQGNTGANEVYTDAGTAFEIRENLKKKYEKVGTKGLTGLSNKFAKVLIDGKFKPPDEWFSELNYYNRLIEEAGGAKKKEAEIKAHVINTAPKMYEAITTAVNINNDGIDKVQEDYQDYYERVVEPRIKEFRGNNRKGRYQAAYAATTPKEVNVIMKNTRRGKPWKKFKGSCNKCGKQGHKAIDCHANVNAVGPATSAEGFKETRKCFRCGKAGHPIKNCRMPKSKSASPLVGMCTTITETENTGAYRNGESKPELTKN
jgi:hypothetical protein